MKKLLCVLFCSLAMSAAFAKAENTMIILKTTHLSGEDAVNFQKIFSNIKGKNKLSIICSGESCNITTSIDGFSGRLATKLLRGRKDATFTSSDSSFKMHCAKNHKTEFCNIIQHNSILN